MCACVCLQIKHEHELNKLDETVGDSDCGSTLAAIARLFLDQIQLSKSMCAGHNGLGSLAKCCIQTTNPHEFVRTYIYT